MKIKYKGKEYIVRELKCGKRIKLCFVPFCGNGLKICRRYEMGQCPENLMEFENNKN